MVLELTRDPDMFVLVREKIDECKNPEFVATAFAISAAAAEGA